MANPAMTKEKTGMTAGIGIKADMKSLEVRQITAVTAIRERAEVIQSRIPEVQNIAEDRDN